MVPIYELSEMSAMITMLFWITLQSQLVVSLSTGSRGTRNFQMCEKSLVRP